MSTKLSKTDNIRRIKKFSRLLPCKLTVEESLQYGGELAAAIQDHADEEEDQDSLKKEMKARLGAIKARIAGLTTKVARKEELREVEVVAELNFKLDEYQEIRSDTGEVINHRPIKDEERQESIPVNDRATDKDDGDGDTF